MAASRIASISGWITLAAILAFEVILPSVVIGQRVTAQADRPAIEAYYGHASLLWFGLLGFVTIIAFVVFVSSLREVLLGHEAARSWASTGFAFAIVAASLLIVRAATQMAVVRGIEAGSDVLPTFFTMDFVYDAGLYAMEAGYVLAFGLGFAATGSAPRWYLPLAGLVAVLQLVGMTSQVIGLPDAATLPGNLAFAGWFGATAWLVGRTPAAARSLHPATGVA